MNHPAEKKDGPEVERPMVTIITFRVPPIPDLFNLLNPKCEEAYQKGRMREIESREGSN